MYARGRGVPYDMDKAIMLITKAADQGLTDARYRIGRLYRLDIHYKNLSKAQKWYEKAAGRGNADAMYELGQLHENRKTLLRNLKKAIEWYGKASDAGHMKAQEHISTVYELASNDAGIAGSIRKAAEQGHAWAEFNLGVMYQQGITVPQDANKGSSLVRKAAEQGFEPAQLEMAKEAQDGKLKGEGSPKDPKKGQQYLKDLREKRQMDEMMRQYAPRYGDE